MSHRTAVQENSSPLCASCQKINFAACLPNAWLDVPTNTVGPNGEIWESGMYVRWPDGRLQPRPMWSDSEKWDLGLLEDVVSRADICPLCDLIIKVLKRHRGVDGLSTEVEGHKLPYSVYPQKIGDVQQEVGVCPFPVAKSGWCISQLGISCSERLPKEYPYRYVGFGIEYAAQIGPSLRIPSSKAKTASYLGRYRPIRCDVSLFKDWIDRCLIGHPQCSDNSCGIRKGPLRLIDVEENCLRTFTHSNDLNLQYLTLSYVWGDGAKDFVLTRENSSRFHEPNGLGRLPKTISDAISLVRALGQKFLWVDALCILQNDPIDHAVQIPAMKSIYGGSLLTIIAAFGDSAEAGLPGINVDRLDHVVAEVGQFSCFDSVDVLDFSGRNLQQYIGEFSVIESTAPLEPFKGSPIIQTTWNTRAWTFQEYLLSPRSIIFLEGQTYWSCRRAEWFEDMDFDGTDFRFIWGNDNISGRTELTVKNYGLLIEQYTKRKLTYERDIYDAFCGILESIPDDFFWGIPYSMFGEYLCWTEDWSANREQASIGLQWRYFQDAPSWSWIAWKGPISMRYDGSPPASLISCFRLVENNLVQISTPSAASSRRKNDKWVGGLPIEMAWSSPDEYACTMEQIPSDVSLNENHIIFHALVAKVSGRQNRNHYRAGSMEKEQDEESSRSYALIGTHGWDDLHLLELSWESGVAKRVSLVSWSDLPPAEMERRLVILG